MLLYCEWNGLGVLRYFKTGQLPKWAAEKTLKGINIVIIIVVIFTVVFITITAILESIW